MLASRLATSAVMISAVVAVLVFDQRYAPWFPLWLVTSAIIMALSSLEVVNLLRASGARASANTVIGGTLALVAANWLPHMMAATGIHGIELDHHPSAAAQALAWPMWAFAAIVMASFL